MTRLSLAAFVSSSLLLAAACGGSSGGGGDVGPGNLEAEALRHELFAAGIRPLPDPPPVSDELFRLGQALFFDKILSSNEDVSCATCHVPQFSTGDARNLADGVGGVGLGPERDGGTIVPRNSLPLFALHLKDRLFWDGRVQKSAGVVSIPVDRIISDDLRASFSPELELLALQAMLPPVTREEMRGDVASDPSDPPPQYHPDPASARIWKALAERLLDLPGYVELLRAAYPDVEVQDFDFGHAANAIAAFEVRAFGRTNSPFERFVRGDDKALRHGQLIGGLEFFGPAGCARCHSGSLFSDQEHHNIGLPQFGPGVGLLFPEQPSSGFDLGRENATFLIEDRFKFRTPTLLNVELTGPYGHAGQFAELRDFVAHYLDPRLSAQQYDIQANVSDPELVTTLTPNTQAVLATLDPRLQAPSDFDVDAVVEFLRSLTADDARDLSEIVPESVPSGLSIF